MADPLDALIDGILGGLGPVTKPDGFIDYDEFGNPFIWQGGKLVPAPPGTPPRPSSAAAVQAAGPPNPVTSNVGDRWEGNGPQGYGTYILDAAGNPGQFVGDPRRPPAPNVNVSVAQPPAQDAQRFMYNGQPWLQLETRTPGQDAKVQYQNTVTGEIVTNLPAPTAADKPGAESSTTGFNADSKIVNKDNYIYVNGQVVGQQVGTRTVPLNGWTFSSTNGKWFPPGVAKPAAATAPAAAPATTPAPGAAPAAPPPGAPQTPQAPAPPIEGTGRNYGFETPGGGSGETSYDPETNTSKGTSGGYPTGPNSITGLDLPKRISIKDQYGNSVRYKGGSGLASGIGTATGVGSRGRIRDLIRQGFFNDQPTLPQEVSLDDQPFRPLTEEELAMLPGFAGGGSVVAGGDNKDLRPYAYSTNPKKTPDFSTPIYGGGSDPWLNEYLQGRYQNFSNLQDLARADPSTSGGFGGGSQKFSYIPDSVKPYLKGDVITPMPGQTAANAPSGFQPYWAPNSELSFVKDVPAVDEQRIRSETTLGNWLPAGMSSYEAGRLSNASLRAARAANPRISYQTKPAEPGGFGSGYWNTLTNPGSDERADPLGSPGDDKGGQSQFLMMLMKLLGLGMAEGGTMMSDEPTMGIGMQTGQPKFMLGEAGPELLQITPTQPPMRQETNPALLNLFAQTSAKKTRFMTPMGM